MSFRSFPLLVVVLLACGPEKVEPLTLSAMSPEKGSARGGMTVTFTGSGFGDAPVVKFGTLVATVTSVNETTLEVIAPTSAAGVATVQVASGGQTISWAAGFTYEPLSFDLYDAADRRFTIGPIAGGLPISIDADGDGDLDVFQPARGEGVFLHVNSAGTLTQQKITLTSTTADGGVPALGDIWSIAAADFDGDAKLDLILGTTGKSQTKFLRGQGSNRFALPAADAGLVLPVLFGTSQQLLPLDVEADGDLDLFIVGASTTSDGAANVVLLINDGSGTFTDETVQHLAGPRLAAAGLTIEDLDGDGDADLFFAMGDESNRLFLGDGRGNFQLAAGDALPHDVKPQARTASAGDINEDGFIDLYVPTATQDRVFINDGTAHFADLTEAFLGPEINASWSSQLIDLDLDGHLDVVIVDRPGRVRFLRNDGKGRLFDYSANVVGNDADANSAGVCLGDFDRDGLKEIFVSRSALARPALFVQRISALDSDKDGWPDIDDACPQKKDVAQSIRSTWGCDSAAGCAAKTGCELRVNGSSSYLVCPATKSWQDAKAACAGFGGSLVAVDGAEENAAISSGLPAAMWIGLDDLVTEGQWQLPSGTPATFFNWGAMQPDNAGTAGEDCVTVSATGAFNDLICSAVSGFICEGARVFTATSATCETTDAGLR